MTDEFMDQILTDCIDDKISKYIDKMYVSR